MKYIIMDEKKNDIFTEEFEIKSEAIKEAKREWDKMSEYDKKSRKRFYVLESENPDEESENHYDGNPVWEAKLEGNDILWEKEIPADINEIRELSGLSGTKFAEKYHIPYRTYMDWVHGKTKPQNYLLELLERAVREDYNNERI